MQPLTKMVTRALGLVTIAIPRLRVDRTMERRRVVRWLSTQPSQRTTRDGTRWAAPKPTCICQP